jgi:hypothetical protein
MEPKIKKRMLQGALWEIEYLPRHSCSPSHHTSSCSHKIIDIRERVANLLCQTAAKPGLSCISAGNFGGQDGLKNPLSGQGGCKTCLSQVSPRALRPRHNTETIKHVFSLTRCSQCQSSDGKGVEGLPLSEAAHLSSSKCAPPGLLNAAGSTFKGSTRLQLLSGCAGEARCGCSHY